MERDSLDDAIDRWVDAGVIDEGTAAEIRAFERERTTSSSNR